MCISKLSLSVVARCSFYHCDSERLEGPFGGGIGLQVGPPGTVVGAGLGAEVRQGGPSGPGDRPRPPRDRPTMTQTAPESTQKLKIRRPHRRVEV